ncbi:MAG: hypothetical protein NO516_01040 [Candidatus Methanomethylicia archaeon]|nr:hypothetical protein [Candidatus Methanomethylicia archaeon]
MELKVREALATRKLDIAVYGALAAITILAVAIRLLPMKWGIYLDEFDPYIQYKGAMYVVENGFNAWYSWFDPTRWAPWGAYQYQEGLLGVPFTGAAIYLFLQAIGIGVSLYNVAVFFPVFAGALIVILAFFLGKELVNRGVGLLSAFIMAIDPTSVQRTALGFFDTESVGMLGFFLSLIFFLKAQKGRTIPYSIISGLSLAYMALAWRVFLYPMNFIALFAIVMVLIGKWSKQLTTSISIIFSITLFTLAVTPSYGISLAISPYTIVPIAAFAICLVRSMTETIEDQRRRQLISLYIVIGLVVAFGALMLTGIFGDISGKFLALINPFSRAEIRSVGTVGEQFPSIWSHFFYYYHLLVILAPLGVYYAIKRGKRVDIFIVLLALTALYGAGSYVRLLILVAPTISILAGYALVRLMSSVSTVIRQQADRKVRAGLLSKYYGAFVIAIVVIAMIPVAYTNLRGADRPAMIVSSSTGVQASIPDWMEALAWMRDNLPPDSVIGTWWDYGYWINVMANLSVVDDNSTTNGTQIQLVAEAFLNNETISLRNFKMLNVTHVVVFEPFQPIMQSPPLALPPWQILGDFEKSTAMMVWVGYNSSEYIQSIPINLGGQILNYPLPAGPKAADATLYKLLFYPYISGYQHYLNITINPPQNYQLIFSSSDAWVLVYKINYP